MKRISEENQQMCVCGCFSTKTRKNHKGGFYNFIYEKKFSAEATIVSMFLDVN